MLNAEQRTIGSVFSTNRIEALTDGVFAIVMTILVLELGIPIATGEPVHTELSTMLLAIWPKFVSYFVTFLILGHIWSMHYYHFNGIRRSDIILVWTNIIFLMFLALLPFSTSLLGRHINERLSVLIWGGNWTACIIVRYVQWLYATKNYRLIDKDISPLYLKRTKILMSVNLVVFIIGTSISFINTIAAICVIVAFTVYIILYTFHFRSVQVISKPKK
jgi:uncharacterized membrane protein